MIAAAVVMVKSKLKTTAGEKHYNKTEFLCFSLIWLHRHTRPATLLSSLGVINERALHGVFGIVSFSMP